MNFVAQVEDHLRDLGAEARKNYPGEMSASAATYNSNNISILLSLSNIYFSSLPRFLPPLLMIIICAHARRNVTQESKRHPNVPSFISALFKLNTSPPCVERGHHHLLRLCPPKQQIRKVNNNSQHRHHLLPDHLHHHRHCQQHPGIPPRHYFNLKMYYVRSYWRPIIQMHPTIYWSLHSNPFNFYYGEMPFVPTMGYI